MMSSCVLDEDTEVKVVNSTDTESPDTCAGKYGSYIIMCCTFGDM